MNSTSQNSSLVVYTVLFGQRAKLNKPPISQNANFVCLTDQTDLEPNGWEIRTLNPIFPDDIPRSSRHPKINPHLYFDDYSRSIYIDSSVLLVTDPEVLWSELVNSDQVLFGGIAHSFHVNMLEELEAVSLNGYEANETITSQARFILGFFNEYLSARPIWGGVLARRHNAPECKHSMELWFSLIMDHSRRDQLSLPVALRTFRGDQVQVSFLDNLDSRLYKWPVGGYVKPSTYLHANSSSLKLETGHLDRVDRLSVNQLTVRHELNKLTTERDALTTERDAILSTKLWRWTKGIRNLIVRLRQISSNGPDARAANSSDKVETQRKELASPKLDPPVTQNITRPNLGD